MKWVVIQTNLANWPLDPEIDIVTTSDDPKKYMDELQHELDGLERNDANIQAVPLLDLLIKVSTGLGYIKPGEIKPTKKEV